jgi:two-component system response regulator PilR (NtrC family)
MAPSQHILVVDDEPHIWHLLNLQFSELGYVLDIAPSIAAARTLLGSGRRFDAVLLDLHLPDGSGLEILREWGGHPPVPVLVLTGESADRMLDDVRALGAVVLTKPFSPSKLAARVMTLVGAPPAEPA